MIGPLDRNTYTYDEIKTLGPILLTWLTATPAWINKHIPNKVGKENIYPFPDFNGAPLKFGMYEKFHPALYNDVITYACWGYSWHMFVTWSPDDSQVMIAMIGQAILTWKRHKYLFNGFMEHIKPWIVSMYQNCSEMTVEQIHLLHYPTNERWRYNVTSALIGWAQFIWLQVGTAIIMNVYGKLVGIPDLFHCECMWKYVNALPRGNHTTVPIPMK